MKALDYTKYTEGIHDLFSQIEEYLIDVINKYGHDGVLMTGDLCDESFYIIGDHKYNFRDVFYVAYSTLGDMNVIECEKINSLRLVHDKVFVCTDFGNRFLDKLKINDVIDIWHQVSICIDDIDASA